MISHSSTFLKRCFSLFYKSTCHFGDFQPPLPVCCPSLPYISNSGLEFINSYSDDGKVTVIFTCKFGYLLSGPSQLSCDLKRGEWSRPFPLLPSCSPIPCLAPPHDPHGRFISPVMSEHFEEGDVLVLKCDDQYHPSHNDQITCRNGEWRQVSSCEPNARLIDTYNQGYKLHGKLQQWTSGAWTNMVNPSHAKRLAEFCCTNRELEFHETTYSWPIEVQCIKIKLGGVADSTWAKLRETSMGMGGRIYA